MERLFVECAIRAALLVGGTAIVLYVMRVKAAAAKHSIWGGVMALMLVLPIWAAWGPKVSLHLLPPVAQITANEALIPARNLQTALRPLPFVSTWQALLSGRLSVGVGLATVSAGNRHRSRPQIGSRRRAPRHPAHQSFMRRTCNRWILPSSGDFSGPLAPMAPGTARGRLDSRG